MQQQLSNEIEATIRARAYEIWEAEGRPEGRHDIHWQRAVEAIATVAPFAPVSSKSDGAIVAPKPTRAKAGSPKTSKKK